MSSNKKTGAIKSSEIIFNRRYPFYCSVQNQAKSRTHKKSATESYYFQVTVSAWAPLNKATGMSVNLMQLDHIAKNIFKTVHSPELTLNHLLKSRLKLLEKSLKSKKIKLAALQFDECRGLCLKFQGHQSFSIHHDFAADENGDLFKVSSQFNEKDELVEMEIKNLKLEIHERIIF